MTLPRMLSVELPLGTPRITTQRFLGPSLFID